MKERTKTNSDNNTGADEKQLFPFTQKCQVTNGYNGIIN